MRSSLGLAVRRGFWLAVGLIACFSVSAHGQQAWTHLERMPANVEAGEACIRPEKFATFRMDRRALEAMLASAPREFAHDGLLPLRLSIPMPDGSLERFDVVTTPVMPDELAARFPTIRTFRGRGVDRPELNLRFDLTPGGFHASILSPASADGTGGEIYVDPYTLREDAYYASYYTKDHAASHRPFECRTPGADALPVSREIHPGRSGSELRTYRLACSLTGEATTTFSQQQGHASNVTDGMAALVTIINRVNQILESEVAVRAVLISNNDQLIFTNPSTDPFTNTGSDAQTNTDHSNYLAANIGNANFDYAHVITTGTDFGNAGAIGTACTTTSKGLGMSSASPVPLDNLAVKLVCHEMGHQFGANHSFNSCFGGQSGPQTYAIEPGSGSSLMGYNGICSAQENLQAFVDAMYNSGAYDQIIAYTTTGVGSTCPVVTQTGNTPPGVDAGPDYVIPKGTPFTLTAQGADADGDPLTYSWEDRSMGVPQTPPADNGQSPIVRVRLMSASPSRTVPALANLLAGTSSVGERLPGLGRTAWTFRATARDSRSGGGGVATDEMVLRVDGNSGPFRVTGPTAGSSVTGSATITWDVAGTSAAPVSAAEVRILFSIDGGLTFPTVLAAAVPNTGSASVLLPNLSTTQARVKVEAIGNVFFAISPGNFTTQFVPAGVILASGGATSVVDVAGNCNRNGFADPGETGVALMIPVTNQGSTVGTNMVGTLTAITPGVEILAGTSPYGDLPYAGISTNASAFLIKIPASHPCSTPIELHLAMTYAQGSGGVDVGVPTSFASQPLTFNFPGGRQIIPDNGARELTIPVSGVPGPVLDATFAIKGSACTDSPGSATVGLVHTNVTQLAISLRDPSGTSVLLWSRNGGNTAGNPTANPPIPPRGDNLCNTVFSDASAFSVSSLVAADGPYTGSWRPTEPLSAFVGHASNGNWVARIEDHVVGETGSVLACGLTLRYRTCAAPRCYADQDDGTGSGRPDGAVTIDDLLYFLGGFEGGSAMVDLDDGSGTGRPDGAVTIDDLLYFLGAFEIGC